MQFFWSEMSAGKTGLRGLLTCGVNGFRGGRLVVAAYRAKRCCWLLLGRWHWISAALLWPFYAWCRLLGGRHEIPPQADIGPGFRVIHCSLACVVNELTVAGRNLYLTGGNVLGVRRVNLQPGALRLGEEVMLGIRAMAIGPLVLGDRVRIGAGATVIKDVPAGATVVGSPVRCLLPEETSPPS